MDSWHATFLGLRHLPREVTAFEIEAFYQFSAEECRVIEERRRPELKLALALQIGFLRMSGRLLEAVRIVPPLLWKHLGARFNVAAPDQARLDPRRQTPSIGIYSHVRDRWGIFNAQPLVLNEQRQAGAAIEGVVRHEEIEIAQLAVDTHGYTDFAMALAKMLGFDLCPRLKALKDRHLFLPRGTEIPESVLAICLANVDLQHQHAVGSGRALDRLRAQWTHRRRSCDRALRIRRPRRSTLRSGLASGSPAAHRVPVRLLSERRVPP